MDYFWLNDLLFGQLKAHLPHVPLLLLQVMCCRSCGLFSG
jgi:hypothetical protein